MWWIHGVFWWRLVVSCGGHTEGAAGTAQHSMVVHDPTLQCAPVLVGVSHYHTWQPAATYQAEALPHEQCYFLVAIFAYC